MAFENFYLKNWWINCRVKWSIAILFLVFCLNHFAPSIQIGKILALIYPKFHIWFWLTGTCAYLYSITIILPLILIKISDCCLISLCIFLTSLLIPVVLIIGIIITFLSNNRLHFPHYLKDNLCLLDEQNMV